MGVLAQVLIVEYLLVPIQTVKLDVQQLAMLLVQVLVEQLVLLPVILPAVQGVPHQIVPHYVV